MLVLVLVLVLVRVLVLVVMMMMMMMKVVASGLRVQSCCLFPVDCFVSCHRCSLSVVF